MSDIKVTYTMTSTYEKHIPAILVPDEVDQTDPDALWDWFERGGRDVLTEVDHWVDTDPGSIEVDNVEVE